MQAVALVLAHMEGMVATPELDGAKPVKTFAYNLGGRQGGSETAVVFADMMEAIVSPIIHRWAKDGWGFRIDDRVLCSHLIWAELSWLPMTISFRS